jgi:hypothetical protein
MTQDRDRDRFSVVQLLADHPELDADRLRALVEAPSGRWSPLFRAGDHRGSRRRLGDKERGAEARRPPRLGPPRHLTEDAW